MLCVAVARSSSGSVAIRYVLPVLWMTARFHTMGRMGQNQVRRYVSKKFARWQYQLTSDNYMVSGSVYQNAAPGAKSVLSTVYD